MSELETGAVFAGHRIEGIAGRGGMGAVYRARHLALDHVVALKVIAPALAHDPSFRRRFESESRIAVSIRHPNVLAVHNAGEEDGLLFVTMDFVEGTDLRGLLAERGRLEPERAARITSEVASALDAAHERGLVHRDIKPGNILIAGEGEGDAEQVFLTDFGLTKRVEADSGLTATGVFVGTINYCAPEQITARTVDARTDVYALGCVLYEMLTGDVPFPAEETVAKMHAHLNEPPPRPRDAVPGLPPGLDAVVQRAMAKVPRERFPSAGDLARAAVAAARGAVLPAVGERSVATGAAAPVTPAPLAQVPEPPAPAVPPTRAAESPAPVPPTVPAAVPPPPVEAAPTAEGQGRPAIPVAGETVPAPPGPAAPAPSGAARTRPLPQLRARQRLMVGGGALAVAAVVAVGLALALGGGEEAGPGAPGTTTGGGGGGGGGATEVRLSGQPIPVEGMPIGVSIRDGELWVGSRRGGSISRIDPESGEVTDTIGGLGAPEGIDVGPASVWVALGGEDAVARIDHASGAVIARVAVGSDPRDVVHEGGAVWVTNGGSDTVSRVDPLAQPEEVVAEIDVGASPHGVALGAGSAWVTNREDGTVSRIDSETNEVTATISVGSNPKGIAFMRGSAWVANTDDDTVVRIDAAVNAVVGDPIDVGATPRGIAAGFGSVWVACGGGALSRIDPASATVVGELDLPGSPEEVAAGDEFVWVTAGTGDQVLRIEP